MCFPILRGAAEDELDTSAGKMRIHADALTGVQVLLPRGRLQEAFDWPLKLGPFPQRSGLCAWRGRPAIDPSLGVPAQNPEPQTFFLLNAGFRRSIELPCEPAVGADHRVLSDGGKIRRNSKDAADST